MNIEKIIKLILDKTTIQRYNENNKRERDKLKENLGKKHKEDSPVGY